MKQLLLGLLAMVVTTFGGDAAWIEHPEYIPVRPVGTVPEAFVEVVEENLFPDCVASRETLLKVRTEADGLVLTVYDLYGQTLAEQTLEVDLRYRSPYQLVPVSDGGFLLVVAFSDRYDQSEGAWASQLIDVSSAIYKLNALGDVEWAYEAEGCNGPALAKFCELPDGYLFCGDRETPETKKLGVFSATDVHLLKLGKGGELLAERTMGGSHFDGIWGLRIADDRIEFSVYSQSSDGDFPSDGPFTIDNIPEDGDWLVVLDQDLNVLEKLQPEDKADLPTSIYDYGPIGILDGRPVYPDDAHFADIRGSWPRLLLDYGDFYLIVATHITGEYPDKPIIVNSTWYTYETVYSAYDKTNRLLWRTAVDSTPDYPSAGGLH